MIARETMVDGEAVDLGRIESELWLRVALPGEFPGVGSPNA